MASADLVVVGTGVAGLTAALDAAELGLRVVVVTKDSPGAGCTALAQGGVAVVLGDIPGDSVSAHISDTLAAGGGLNHAAAVASIIADGPAALARLRARGAIFDIQDPLAGSSIGAEHPHAGFSFAAEHPSAGLSIGADDPYAVSRAGTGRLARTREGGHSALRVVHAGGDATGAEIERALVTAATDRRFPLLTGHVATDMLRDEAGAVAGLAVLDDHGRPGVLRAPAVLLATGGYGQLFASTTNPAGATGDGVALALRAGATASDLEFVQFHPTVLYAGPGVRGSRPLVTEAVRGEGAVLLDRTGSRFMTGVHPLADLAPRDVVAAAITRRLAETGSDCVWLDGSAIPGFATRFPTVHAACRLIGIDPAREPIPVTPAAHYACGGVVTDVDGRTGVRGLYAAGEVARTGLHGANRLASNSLLEGLAVGARAARAVAADLAASSWTHRAARPPAPAMAIADRAAIQRAMSAGAGIGRDAAGLAAASDTVEAVTVLGTPIDRAGFEDAALTLLAQAVLAAAGTRTESRGCHVRTDFPQRDDVWQRSSLIVTLDESGRPVVAESFAVAGAA